MSATDLMRDFGAMLVSGGVEVVDCSGVLGPDTPILQLPADFAKPTPKVQAKSQKQLRREAAMAELGLTEADLITAFGGN